MDDMNEYVDKAINEGDYRYLFCTSLPTCRFYKREFLEKHHLRLHEVRWSTEVTFWAQCAVLAEKYTASPLNIYCLVSTPNGLTKDKSVQCLRVRSEESNTEVAILRKKFEDFEYVFYWQYRTWLNVYLKSKKAALSLLPAAINAGRRQFLMVFLKNFPLDIYAHSRFLKTFWRKIKQK